MVPHPDAGVEIGIFALRTAAYRAGHPAILASPSSCSVDEEHIIIYHNSQRTCDLGRRQSRACPIKYLAREPWTGRKVSGVASSLWRARLFELTGGETMKCCEHHGTTSRSSGGRQNKRLLSQDAARSLSGYRLQFQESPSRSQAAVELLCRQHNTGIPSSLLC